MAIQFPDKHHMVKDLNNEQKQTRSIQDVPKKFLDQAREHLLLKDLEAESERISESSS
jgi:hypothetical protein